MKLSINIDGACRGNPGLGSVGVQVRDSGDRPVLEISKAIGHCTNNVAEYTALAEALSAAKALGGTELHIFSDSLLLVKQFNGEYKIKNPTLARFLVEIHKKAQVFKKVVLSHVRREFNKEADRLANEALDEQAARSKGVKKNFEGTAGGPLRAQVRGGTSELHRERRG